MVLATNLYKFVHRQMVYDGQAVNLGSLNPGAYMISIEHNGKKEIYNTLCSEVKEKR